MILLIYFNVDVNLDTADNLTTQLFIFDPPIKKVGMDILDFDKYKLINNRTQYILYSVIGVTVIQGVMYLIWIFFKFHITFWINHYEYDEKNYYLIKKKVKEENYDGTNMNMDNIILFDDEQRNKYKIFHLFSNPKNYKFFTQSNISNLIILFKTLFLEYETKFIIWGIIFNLIYMGTNSPLLIILQIFSVYNFSPFIQIFVEVFRLKYKSFITLLVMTWIVQYVFSWIAFIFLQEIFVSDFRFIDQNYQYDEEVKNYF
jgi:hypothetical protein